MQALLEYKAQIELYKNIFYFSLIVGLVFAILTILLCVIFRVDEVVGDITGAYRRKAIKKHKGEVASSTVNRERKRSQYGSNQYARNRSRSLETTEEITARLRGTSQLESTIKLGASIEGNATAKLGHSIDMEETVPLNMQTDETVLLHSDMISDETVVLSSDDIASDETVVLSVNDASDETDELVSDSVVLEEDVVISSSNNFL